ncbi:normal mucosa of esophagus-specific gene 1 protein-like [Glandiceps talaboti]
MTLFGLRVWRKHYELTPLVAIISFVCCMSSSALAYAAYHKSDVIIRKDSNPYPYYRIDPTKPQKLLTINQKYVPDAKLEQLRKEIGSPPSPR